MNGYTQRLVDKLHYRLHSSVVVKGGGIELILGGGLCRRFNLSLALMKC